jgi:hypothetical protein
MQVLQYMKHQINGVGGVLVITLHQPGSEVSQLIDDLLLLGYGGSPVFMGPWAAALNYFTGHLGKTPQLFPGKTRKAGRSTTAGMARTAISLKQ